MRLVSTMILSIAVDAATIAWAGDAWLANARRSGESRRLVITANPFFTKTDANGAFHLNGVPAGRVHVTALGEGTRSAGRDGVVEAGGTTRLDLAW